MATPDIQNRERILRTSHLLHDSANVLQVHVISDVVQAAEYADRFSAQYLIESDADQALHPLMRQQRAIGISHAQHGAGEMPLLGRKPQIMLRCELLDTVRR